MTLNLKNIEPKLVAGIFATGVITPYVFSFLKYLVKKVVLGNKKPILKTYAAVEMGGTNFKVAIADVLVDEDGNITDIKIVKDKSDRVNDADCDQTIRSIGQFLGDKEYDFIGIASFGPICLDQNSTEFGNITSTPKQHWRNYPLLTKIKANTKAKRYGFDTDVNAPALAELKLGGHNASESLVYVTVGTGVGVGIVANGNTIHGLVHPQGGHTIVNKHPEQWQNFQSVCPYHKNCLQGYVTNNAIASRYGIEKVDLQNLKDDDKIWKLIGFYLAQLCYNITLLVSPQVIVLGGGIMNRTIIFQYIYQQFTNILNGYVQHPKLQRQNLKNYIRSPNVDDLALKGAMMLKPI